MQPESDKSRSGWSQFSLRSLLLLTLLVATFLAGRQSMNRELVRTQHALKEAQQQVQVERIKASARWVIEYSQRVGKNISLNRKAVRSLIERPASQEGG